ncbi:hypothetical protein cyc_08734 [Cyclospora cayetanensis]|uniref:Uncharacterized protein n=1 Tax=Cyclospora cayetanensis TaxID=88456 RepID=A0A1D3D9W6_9EIME|nr:hypothetical protein cyc_08734 [Cyclospora cayetanensis]
MTRVCTDLLRVCMLLHAALNGMRRLVLIECTCSALPPGNCEGILFPRDGHPLLLPNAAEVVTGTGGTAAVLSAATAAAHAAASAEQEEEVAATPKLQRLASSMRRLLRERLLLPLHDELLKCHLRAVPPQATRAAVAAGSPPESTARSRSKRKHSLDDLPEASNAAGAANAYRETPDLATPEGTAADPDEEAAQAAAFYEEADLFSQPEEASEATAAHAAAPPIEAGSADEAAARAGAAATATSSTADADARSKPVAAEGVEDPLASASSSSVRCRGEQLQHLLLPSVLSLPLPPPSLWVELLQLVSELLQELPSPAARLSEAVLPAASWKLLAATTVAAISGLQAHLRRQEPCAAAAAAAAESLTQCLLLEGLLPPEQSIGEVDAVAEHSVKACSANARTWRGKRSLKEASGRKSRLFAALHFTVDAQEQQTPEEQKERGSGSSSSSSTGGPRITTSKQQLLLLKLLRRVATLQQSVECLKAADAVGCVLSVVTGKDSHWNRCNRSLESHSKTLKYRGSWRVRAEALKTLGGLLSHAALMEAFVGLDGEGEEQQKGQSLREGQSKMWETTLGSSKEAPSSLKREEEVQALEEWQASSCKSDSCMGSSSTKGVCLLNVFRESLASDVSISHLALKRLVGAVVLRIEAWQYLGALRSSCQSLTQAPPQGEVAADVTAAKGGESQKREPLPSDCTQEADSADPLSALSFSIASDSRTISAEAESDEEALVVGRLLLGGEGRIAQAADALEKCLLFLQEVSLPPLSAASRLDGTLEAEISFGFHQCAWDPRQLSLQHCSKIPLFLVRFLSSTSFSSSLAAAVGAARWRLECLPGPTAADKRLLAAVRLLLQNISGCSNGMTSVFRDSQKTCRRFSLLASWLEALCGLGEAETAAHKIFARCLTSGSNGIDCGSCRGCRMQLVAAQVLATSLETRYAVCTEWDVERTLSCLEETATADLPSSRDTHAAGLLAATTVALRLRFTARALAFKAFGVPLDSDRRTNRKAPCGGLHAEALTALAALTSSPAGAAVVAETLIFSRLEG